MKPQLSALRTSVGRLQRLVEALDDAALEAAAYPSEWTRADVLSHLGSGAVIMGRHLEDGLTGQATTDDFASTVWATWNAKPARARADEALVADRQLLEQLESLSDDEGSRFTFAMGPITVDIAGFVGLRLNEHAFHTWDIEVADDPAATVPPEAAALVVDNLELVARFTARPTGDTALITVATTDPARDFTIELMPDAVTLTAQSGRREHDLQLPAEAFSRVVYGRLDPDHTPTVEGDTATLAILRRVFPGP